MNNNVPTIRIAIDEGAKKPTRAHDNDAGLDLYAAEDKVIFANSFDTVETGIHIEIPEGYVGLLTSKSGLMRYNGVTCRGTIDPGYTGSVKAIIFNHGGQMVQVKAGEKITQMVIVPCITPSLEVVDELPETERGNNGFGSTGK